MHIVSPSSLCCRFTTSVNLQTRPTRARREGAPSCLRHSGQPAATHGGTHYGWFCPATSQPGSRVGGNSASSLTPAAVRGLPMRTTGGKLKQQCGWWTCTDASTLRPRVPGPGPFHAPSLHCCSPLLYHCLPPTTNCYAFQLFDEMPRCTCLTMNAIILLQVLMLQL